MSRNKALYTLHYWIAFSINRVPLLSYCTASQYVPPRDSTIHYIFSCVHAMLTQMTFLKPLTGLLQFTGPLHLSLTPLCLVYKCLRVCACACTIASACEMWRMRRYLLSQGQDRVMACQHVNMSLHKHKHNS